MNTLCIVPCGKAKIWDKYPDAGPTAARDVYIGGFSTKCRHYAMMFYPDSWCIISARYGFLSPDDVVAGPYDACFYHPATNPVSVDFLRMQAEQRRFNMYEEVIVLGGKHYVKMVKQVFRTTPVIAPLEGCRGIGYMMNALNRAMQRGIPLGPP
jgi:hypothetical protein